MFPRQALVIVLAAPKAGLEGWPEQASHEVETRDAGWGRRREEPQGTEKSRRGAAGGQAQGREPRLREAEHGQLVALPGQKGGGRGGAPQKNNAHKGLDGFIEKLRSESDARQRPNGSNRAMSEW